MDIGRVLVVGRGVTVIGNGIIGLSAAVALQDDGFAVTVKSAERPAQTTSSIAGAVWHPFFQGPDPTYLRRALETYDRMTALAQITASGVRRRRLTEYFLKSSDPPWWMTAMDSRGGIERASAADRYAGAYTLAVFVADTSLHLTYLADLIVSRGGVIERTLVTSLADEAASAAWVVNCAGFGSAHLVGDRSLYPVRGIVLRCEKPTGFSGCWIDDADPSRPTYAIERENDVILGGVAEPGLLSTVIGEEVIEDIRARCMRLVPAVEHAQVVEVRVGFRPARDNVRLERDAELANVIHNYGHGGSGFTLAWGCAADVKRLVSGVG